MKKSLILGFGVSGKAVAKYFERNQVPYLVFDDKLGAIVNEQFPLAKLIRMEQLDESDFDQLIVSPGINPNHAVFQKAKSLGCEITNELEIAIKLTNRPLIGITGTNGKTTVTKLISEGLCQLGYQAIPCGNYGLPLIEAILEETSQTIYCVEVSSYQLELMQTKKFSYGLILNITQDHLDRYQSMLNYALAKWRLIGLILDGGKIWIQKGVIDQFQFSINNPVIAIKDANLKEANFLADYAFKEKENYFAAFLVLRQYGMDEKGMLLLLQKFQKPEHRIELIKVIDEISYYDDSKGTNVDAVIFAIERFKDKVILLAGGKDKMSDYTPWIGPFKKKVKLLLLYGEAKELIKKALEGTVEIQTVDRLQDAVQLAHMLAEKGDHVVLSPGCSSFDQFKDYKHRAEVFKSLVAALKSREKNDE
jgi:UDP-N-acetylmuramoylalanine--D-glutamate ligase